MADVDQTAVAQMELGLVIETIAGWLRTNEMAQRRWHELPADERGLVDTPAVACGEQADMLARSTSLETLKVYGDALRGTLAVLSRVQAAHSAEVTVVWQESEGVSPIGDDVEVDGDTAEDEWKAEMEARIVYLERVVRRLSAQVYPSAPEPAERDDPPFSQAG